MQARNHSKPLPWLVCVALAVVGSGCGGGGGDAAPRLTGTVALHNQTNAGMAPQVITALFFVPVGEVDPGPNLLNQPLAPGGIVIVGLFPAGTYNAVAVLASGFNVQFVEEIVVAGQPTDLVVPGS